MDQLPNEILIHILGYLKSYDLVQFCEVFQHMEYFLKEKKIISISDWSRRFESIGMNICSCISIRMDPSHIRVLKINCLYWISGQDLRRLLPKLINLKELYAIDTKLGFKSKDILEYSKLNKLAISVQVGHIDFETVIASKTLKTLTKLYIKIILKKEDHWEAVSGLRLFFCNIRQLEELWVQDDQDCEYRINYERLVVELKNLKKFVVRSKSVLPLYDFTFVGLLKTFECKRCNTDGELIFERITDQKPAIVKSIFDPERTTLEEAWDIFLNFHGDLPCGPKGSKLITLREDINNIAFEDLNFCHTVILCNSKYVKAVHQVLKSENAKELKRLNFRSCLFQDFEETNKMEENKSTGFKKQRVGVRKDILNHPFEKVSKHLKNLAELEIYHCSMCTGSTVISAYPLIENFEKLKMLTLEIPYLIDGAFLEKVFSTCRLEYLNLMLTAPNEPFIMNLCRCLGHAAELKHFRLECFNLAIEKILRAFCKIPRKKLQRMFIKCDQLNYPKNADARDIFSVFLEANPQLIFFVLITSQSTAKQISDIQRTLHKFKEGNSAKMFFIKKEVGAFTGIFPMPPAHHDIIFNRTRVAVIDFDKF